MKKIKIHVPLVQLAKNPINRWHISKKINEKTIVHHDTLNIHDGHPTVMFGLHIEENRDTIAPFYVSLNVQERLLHNHMLDSWASHNLLPKVTMEKLGIEITRP